MLGLQDFNCRSYTPSLYRLLREGCHSMSLVRLVLWLEAEMQQVGMRPG